MATIKLDITVPGAEALARKLEGNITQTEHLVAQQVMKDTSPYVPALTGSLDRLTRVEGNKIIYPGPYARYLYRGKLMVDPETGSSYAKKGASKVLTDKNLVFNKATHQDAQSHWFEASKAQNLDKWLKVAGKAVSKYGK